MIENKEKEVNEKIYPTLIDLVEYNQLGNKFTELFQKIINIEKNGN